MISIEIKKVEDTVNQYQSDIDKFKFSLKQNLIGLLFDNSVTETWQVKYINKILDKKDEIITTTPDELKKLRKDFDDIRKSEIVHRDENKTFRDSLIKEMGYTKRRSDFYPKFFQKLGIKSCVYCNSQLALSVNSFEYDKKGNFKKEKVEAKFQVDHYIPKSYYPCFCISIFNLYPVCASCNNCKSDIDVKFNLYSKNINDITTSQYEFKLIDGCVAKYINAYKKNDIDARDKIKIKFIDPNKTDPNTLSKGSFQDTFDIQGIYDTQKDIVEELILKARVYNLAYKRKLVDSFKKLFTDASLSNRILIGNYSEPENIHKRPMAKFTQDIAKQLKLI